jgi:ubiquinone biosynthesis protein COQ9
MDPGTSGRAQSETDREALLAAALGLAPETGWMDATLRAAAEQLGLDAGRVMLACPNGVADLLDLFARQAADAAQSHLAGRDLSGLKIREKVTAGVRAYLDFLEPHRAAVRRAAGSPYNALSGPKALWAAADAIWAGLGDSSVDFNWYTKRMTLSAVVGSTLVAWLGTEDRAEVDAFLARRIENVMEFERFKKQAADFIARMPNPLDLMGRRPGGTG